MNGELGEVDRFEAEADAAFWEIVPQLPSELIIHDEDRCPTCCGVKGDRPDICPTCARFVGAPVYND